MSVVVWPRYKAQLAVLLGSDCGGLCTAWRGSSPGSCSKPASRRATTSRLPTSRLDLLRPSATRSHCPYKGTASYWSVDTGQAVHTDIVWIYRTPLPESQKIAGLACFYNEKIDLYLDGVLQERAQTKFS